MSWGQPCNQYEWRARAEPTAQGEAKAAAEQAQVVSFPLKPRISIGNPTLSPCEVRSVGTGKQANGQRADDQFSPTWNAKLS